MEKLTDSQKVTVIAKILKKRFPNLSLDEILDMAQEIFNKLER